MAISVIGADFRTARVELREQLALSGEQTLQLLRTVAAEKIFPEAMVLSTCNRTEFYFVKPARPADALEHLLAHIARFKGEPPPHEPSVFYDYHGKEAVRHLFRVAASLESQVVGEHEIMGQVKEAYRLACEARTARFLLHKLLHWTFRAGKRVMSQTNLGQGTASVSQAAVDLARQVFSDLSDKAVLVVGAGQTAELAAQALLRQGVRRLILANRTVARAQQLADSFLQWQAEQDAPARQGPTLDAQGEFVCPAVARLLEERSLQPPAPSLPRPALQTQVISLAEIPYFIAQADVVICSTGSSEPVLTAGALRPILSRRGGSLLMIDIAVPRDIEPALGALANVFLYNIDDVQHLVDENVQRRRQEIPRAEAIVDDEVAQFTQWLSSLDVVPTIKLLSQRMAQLQEAEVRRFGRKFSPEDRRQLEEFARSLCNKILHDPIVFLRELGGDDDSAVDLAAVQTLRKIFDLDKMEDAQE